VGLRLPFVAYAPNLVGVYQVDVTLPDAWPSGWHRLRCEAAGVITEAVLPLE
jgi:uncharacterized protein (TIGR03437 family)